jgi:hypothetical protein
VGYCPAVLQMSYGLMYLLNHYKDRRSGTCVHSCKTVQEITMTTLNYKTTNWHGNQQTNMSRLWLHHGSMLDNIQIMQKTGVCPVSCKHENKGGIRIKEY